MKREVAIAKDKIWVIITDSQSRIDELVKTNKRTIILNLEAEEADRLKNMHATERRIVLDSYKNNHGSKNKR